MDEDKEILEIVNNLPSEQRIIFQCYLLKNLKDNVGLTNQVHYLLKEKEELQKQWEFKRDKYVNEIQFLRTKINNFKRKV